MIDYRPCIRVHYFPKTGWLMLVPTVCEINVPETTGAPAAGPNACDVYGTSEGSGSRLPGYNYPRQRSIEP